MNPSDKLVGSIISLIFGITLFFGGFFYFIFPFLISDSSVSGMSSYFMPFFLAPFIICFLIPSAILLILGIIGLRSYRKTVQISRSDKKIE